MEPHQDINYNIIVVQQAAMCVIGLLLWMWHTLAPEDCGEQTPLEEEVHQECCGGWWGGDTIKTKNISLFPGKLQNEI